MKTYQEHVSSLEPYSGYLHMKYGTKKDRERPNVETWNFERDGKRYRILPIRNVPDCCGAKIFISIDVIPQDILDTFCKHMMPCGELLIFIMPQLPTMSTNICEGVGVANNRVRIHRFDDLCDAVRGLPHFSGVGTYRQRYVNCSAISISRYADNIYFFHSLSHDNGRLQMVKKTLSAKNSNNVLLAIVVPYQDAAYPQLKKCDMKLRYTCTNPKTNRELQLYSTVVGPVPPVVSKLSYFQTFTRAVKQFIQST